MKAVYPDQHFGRLYGGCEEPHDSEGDGQDSSSYIEQEEDHDLGRPVWLEE